MVKGLAAPRAIDTMLDMYLAQTILDAIDRHTVPILVGFSLAMVLQNIAMITAVVMTRRECWISIPLMRGCRRRALCARSTNVSPSRSASAMAWQTRSPLTG
jgi:hypothetical protein